MKGKHIFLTIVSLVVAAGVFYSGVLVGQSDSKFSRLLTASDEGVLTENGQTGAEKANFEPFWEAWKVINNKYIYGDRVKPQEKVWGAIEGLADSLGDPYTVFFPPKESKKFHSSIKGHFGGVGMRVGVVNDMITVIAPLPKTPAAKSGIESGDQIVKIDGESTHDMSIDEAVSKIRGKVGTTVSLIVLREGAEHPLKVPIERAVINIPTVKTHELPGGIFKIDLYQFSANSPELFRDALREFKKTGGHKLIIDLRGNPGGYLGAAVQNSSWFLPLGDVVVKEKRKGEITHVYRSKGYDIFGDDLATVILVDEGTASAAEIMSAALSEHGVATLVGEQTFGKGSVQELVEITPKTALKVTVAKWLTPEGHSFAHEGITPKYVVVADRDEFLAGKDPQLEKAVELLSN